MLDPQSLGPAPPLGDAMRSAGFVLTSEPGVWEARIERAGVDEDLVIPVDLIVPEHVAAKAGRRSARLPGNHGKATARKALGLEGALVDHGPMPVEPLEAGDGRRFMVSVGGVGALFVAKSHKLGERLATPDRLDAKDAGDLYRLFDVAPPEQVAALLRQLLTDDRSARATELAIEYARRLFLTPTSPGVRLAVSALRGIIPEATVVTVMTTYTRSMFEALSAGSAQEASEDDRDQGS